MTIYNLIEYSNDYLETFKSLWQHYGDEPSENIEDSESFEFNLKIARKTTTTGNTKDVKTAVPLKYLCNFWRTLEIPLIKCKIILILSWSSTCVITDSTGHGNFAITDIKLYAPVVSLSTQDNEKLLQH